MNNLLGGPHQAGHAAWELGAADPPVGSPSYPGRKPINFRKRMAHMPADFKL